MVTKDFQVKNICMGTGTSTSPSYYYRRATPLNDIHGLGAVVLAGIEVSKLKLIEPTNEITFMNNIKTIHDNRDEFLVSNLTIDNLYYKNIHSISTNGKMKKAIQHIVQLADTMMEQPNVSVTEKSKEALNLARVNPHEYTSISIYFWENPTDKNAPWIKKDGARNSEWISKYDNSRLGRFQYRVRTLTRAWWMTGDVRYARKAVEQLRTWFLNKDTYMFPQMEKAQFIPNDPKLGDGTCWGIIDANAFPVLLKTIGLLQQSGQLTAQDDAGLKTWFAAFSKWLRASPNGQKESVQPNNHGVHYDVLLASSLLFCGDSATARGIFEESPIKRIVPQIEPDGRMPRELARAGSFGYTCWNLLAFSRLALLASECHVDLWNYRSTDGRSIKKAFDFLIPYIDGSQMWEWNEKVDQKSLFDLYYRAAQIYPDFKSVFANQIESSVSEEECYRRIIDIVFSKL
jgi:hypothetical protein